jgi:hypothetical protein
VPWFLHFPAHCLRGKHMQVFANVNLFFSDISYSTTDLQLSNALAMKDSPEYLYLRRHGRSLAEVQDYDAVCHSVSLGFSFFFRCLTRPNKSWTTKPYVFARPTS